MAARLAGRRVVAVAAALFALGSVAASADEAPPLAFRDDRPLTITAPVPAAGIPVTVCNTTNEPATVTVGDFVKDATPVNVSILVVDPSTVPERTCGEVRVRAAPEGAGDGTYSGVLVAMAPGGGVARRSVVFTKGPAPAGHVTGALAGFELKGHFEFQWNSTTVELYNDALIVTTKGPLADMPDGTVIGTVANGDDIATIKVSGKAAAVREGIARIPVSVTGAGGQGTFKGKLTKLTDKDGNPHDVTVVVADHWGLLVIVVVLGLLTGVLAKALADRWLPGLWLSRRRRRLAEKYDEPGSALCCGYLVPRATDIEKFKQANADAFKAYQETTTLLDAASPAYKAVKDSLVEAENDAALLRGGADSPFCSSLSALAEKVGAFTERFPVVFPNQSVPLFARKAKALVDPPAPQLGVGQATKIKTEAEQATELLDDWLVLAAAYEELWGQRTAVDSPGDHEYQLGRVDEALGRARASLLDVGDSGTLDSDEVVDGLRVAYARLAPLPRVAAPIGPAGVFFGELGPTFVLHGIAAGFPTAFSQAGADALTVGLGLIGAVFVAVVTGGLALLVAMWALYDGKPFGSASDYLTAFAGAAGAQALVGSVFATLGNWRSTRPTA